MVCDFHFSELFMMWCNNANVIFVTGNHCAISYQFYPQHFFSCFLTITSSNLHQIQKVRSVFESAGSKDFKTVPTLDNLPWHHDWEDTML